MLESTWTPEDPKFNRAKRKLLEYYINGNYAKSKLCVNAFERVARSIFVPDDQNIFSYDDRPLPLGYGQTISAPHMAFMECEALEVSPGDKVLEVGSGSGYHASITAEMCSPASRTPKEWEPLTKHYDTSIYSQIKHRNGQVFTMERLEPLVEVARANIEKAGYSDRVTIVGGDGTMGFDEQAPYDKILVTAAGPDAPLTLKKQLKISGKMIIPVGPRSHFQTLILLTRIDENEWLEENLGGVVFVPLIGKHGFDP